jgi:hypothetical protein
MTMSADASPMTAGSAKAPSETRIPVITKKTGTRNVEMGWSRDSSVVSFASSNRSR